MKKELVFKIKNNSYTKDKYYFQKDENPNNINVVGTEKIVLSNKTPHGEQGANKYYISYLSSGFRPLHIAIKNITLYTDHMNVLANDNELLKYTELWKKIEALFNKKFNKKGFCSKPVYNNGYIRTKISLYNENFWGNKRLTKDEYYGHSILLLESICEVKNKYYPQTFLDELFECNSVECNSIECSSIEKHSNNNINSLFKELIQIVDWFDDESSDKS